MIFAHDTEVSLVSAVELVNSAQEPDTLTEIAQLDEFFAKYVYTGAHSGEAAELAAVRALRTTLRRMLTSDRDTTVRLINETLAKHRALPQLVRHDGIDYHVHAVSEQAPLPVRIAVETAMAMIDLIRSDELSRLSLCADESCEGLVLDMSRNRSRRYCSTACGNRNAVAAYRARKK